MRPYVSGKLDKLLQSRETKSYKDLYPTPNTNWYYAVTMVNGNGQEGKIVHAKKVWLKNFCSLCMTLLSLKNGVQLSHLLVTQSLLFGSHVADAKREAWTKKARRVIGRNKARGREILPSFALPITLELPLTKRRLETSEVRAPGEEPMFVICFISQWMKRSKHGLFVFPPKKTLIWRRHCSIGQSCCSMTLKRSIGWFLERTFSGMKFIQPSFRLTTKTRHERLYPLDKPIKSHYFRSLCQVKRKSLWQDWLVQKGWRDSGRFKRESVSRVP